MVFADTEFYEKSFLSSREAIIPLSEFMYWSRMASERINFKKVTLETVPEILKMATCEVAEAMFLDNERVFMELNDSRSESVGGYSRGAVSGIKQKAQDSSANINSIIRRWLADTELHNDFVYRGV